MSLKGRATGAGVLLGFRPWIMSQSSRRKPNVLLIVTNDQGWWDLGVHGNPIIETPILDQLAQDGVRFSHFYASPVCTPTRACLMTGRHYQRTGAYDTCMGRDTMRAEEITLGEIFREQGYRTAAIGKWHLGRYMKYHPNNQGFGEYFGFWQYGFTNRYQDPDQLFHNHEPVTATGYITDVLTDQAITFVKEHQNDSFFLYLPYNAPHSPFAVPDPYIQRYLEKGLGLRDARIYGMITSIDENVGRLLNTIDDLGLAGDTVVIFMSDNGGVSRHFKAGLRGSKGSVYEGGIRVPFIARWPGRFPGGATIDAMAQHIDILPTLCELVGISIPSDRKIDGMSIFPLMKYGGGQSPHTYLFHQWNRVRPALDLPKKPDIPYGSADGIGPQPNWAVRDGRGLKLVVTTEKLDNGQIHVKTELFDLEKDPAEIDLTWGEPGGGDVSESVRWQLEVVRSGRYEIILHYGCEKSNAGSKVLVRAGKSEIFHTVQPTAGRTIFRPFRAGSLSLEKGLTGLEIKPVSIVGDGFMALHKIWLRKVD